MKFISHRGNINGSNPNKENTPSYIIYALELGYDVEIDIWFINNGWYLGHDVPQYKITYDFLGFNNLWLHAKNGDALYHLLQDKTLNVFYHTNENWILTSQQYIWTYPNRTLYPNSICVLPEMISNISLENLKLCYGICSDSIEYYRRNLYV